MFFFIVTRRCFYESFKVLTDFGAAGNGSYLTWRAGELRYAPATRPDSRYHGHGGPKCIL